MKNIVYLVLILYGFGVKLQFDYLNTNSKVLYEYSIDPNKYILSHTNQENFIAMFSKYSNLNGNKLYENYKTHKTGKFYNKFQSTTNKWEYNTIHNKFILPDESKLVLIFS
jgi:hypothetical protein